jgi:hypothetical protein
VAIGPGEARFLSPKKHDEEAITRRELLAVAATPIALWAARVAASSEKAGAVEDIKGEAFAEANAMRRDLEVAAPLFIRDQVGTGDASRLTMRLGRATTVRLGERALLVIDRYIVDAGGEIYLKSVRLGRKWSCKPNKGPPFAGLGRHRQGPLNGVSGASVPPSRALSDQHRNEPDTHPGRAVEVFQCCGVRTHQAARAASGACILCPHCHGRKGP